MCKSSYSLSTPYSPAPSRRVVPTTSETKGADVSDHPHVKPVAIKILKPVGFRLAPEDTLRRCVVAKRGRAPGTTTEGGTIPAHRGSGGASAGAGTLGSAPGGSGSLLSSIGGSVRHHKLSPEHVWWLVSPNTKQVLAAYVDPRYGNLVEVPLPKCIEIWGYNPRTDVSTSSCGSPNSSRSGTAKAVTERQDQDESSYGWGDRDSEGGDGIVVGRGEVEVQVDGMGVSIPWVPPKYMQWLAQRRKVRREIYNMSRVGGHRNVVKLLSVLEFLQDSKSTLFLILELVPGGELLDHIRPLSDNSGMGRNKSSSALRTEGAAQRYFRQLLSGLTHCHRQGVCHR